MAFFHDRYKLVQECCDAYHRLDYKQTCQIGICLLLEQLRLFRRVTGSLVSVAARLPCNLQLTGRLTLEILLCYFNVVRF